jgi:hypothetical protein
MRWLIITAMVLFVLLSIAVSATEYEYIFRDDHFLMDALLHAASGDMNDDGKEELIIVGRDYLDPQALLHIMDLSSERMEPIWTSENIMEEKSPVHLAVGHFLERERLLAVIVTDHRLVMYGWNPDAGYEHVKTITHKLTPGEVCAMDWDGDGVDEIVMSRVTKTGKKYYTERLEVYRVQEGELQIIVTGPEIGNIRSLTAGDIDGDGYDELVLEEGKTSKPGKILVFSTDGEQEWNQLFGPGRLVPAAVYGMSVVIRGEERFLYTASERGRVNIFQWREGNLQEVQEIDFSAGLVSLAAGHFWSNHPGLAVVAYPRSLRLFRLLLEREVDHL